MSVIESPDLGIMGGLLGHMRHTPHEIGVAKECRGAVLNCGSSGISIDGSRRRGKPPAILRHQRLQENDERVNEAFTLIEEHKMKRKMTELKARLVITMTTLMPCFIICCEPSDIEKHLAACDGVITFEDENLARAVRHKLGILQGDLTGDDVFGLHHLDASELEIESLKGLECLSELTGLYLADNKITDISPLAKLTNLQYLSLWGNQIQDISPLSALLDLEYLQIGLNRVSDISPLGNLKKMTHFHAEENPISDLGVLSGLENLEQISIRLGQVSDVSPLTGLPNLDSINLDSNYIVDIEPLSKIASLRYLIIRDNPIRDLEVLATMTQLKDLRISGGDIDLSLFSNYSDLQTLDLEDCGLSDLTPLADLKTLTALWLRDNQVVDLSPIAGLVNLEYLLLEGNEIIDLSSLLDNPGIGEGDQLFITDNPIDCHSQDPIIRELLERGLSIMHDC